MQLPWTPRSPTIRRRAFGAGAVSLCAAAGCSAESSAKRVVLSTELELASGAGEPFTLASGAVVSVTRALVALGSLYYFAGAPAVASHRWRSPFERLTRWFSIPEAHAHPGHYHADGALGQMLEPADLEAFEAADGPVVLGEGNGVSGTYRSASFVFAERADGDTLGDANAVVLLEASVETGGGARDLRFVATFADVVQNAAEGSVAGCVLEETEVDGDGTVIVTFDPRVWLRFADPAALESDEPDVPRESTLFAAFVLGLVQLDAYRFRFVPSGASG